MPKHSYTRIWIHILWTTKNRERSLYDDLRQKLYGHLIKHAKEMGIYIGGLNIQPEHVHCLIDLPPDMKLSDTVKRLKGESSRWINEKI